MVVVATALGACAGPTSLQQVVAFTNVTDPTAKAQLDANMPGQKMGELAGPFIMQPNEAYVISFAKVPAGKYDYVCTPHLAMNMKGVITVQ